MPKEELTHIGTEQEAEFDQQHNDDNDDCFDVGVLNTDDLEEEEVDNSLISVVRRILTAPNVEKEDWRRTSIFQMLPMNTTEMEKYKEKKPKDVAAVGESKELTVGPVFEMCLKVSNLSSESSSESTASTSIDDH
ncbi:hypothetical protein RHGRI_034232 [Rhododendron griersonianum]|uniref:Uncharacterized protein n=1 Tax=Rhododendron griersonianum TaxID=479676 RepID=A0AAV6I5J8_9ERIC|nr:hypothetical protein RHGRI_034232 [Rhododendron griersonianum]